MNFAPFSYMLIRLLASTPTTYAVPQEDTGGVSKDSSNKHVMLCLLIVTAIAVFYIPDSWISGTRDRSRQNSWATLEDDVMGVTGRLLPNTGCPLLDEDDDFKLPPPAYELHEGFLED